MFFFNDDDQEFLNVLNDMYAEAQVKERGRLYASLPDGDYKAFVSRVYTDEPSSESKPYVFVLELQVMEDECDGKHVGKQVQKRYPIIADKVKLGILKSDLEVLGVELPNNDLDRLGDGDFMQSVLDRVLEICIRTKQSNDGRKFMNIYINKLVGMRTPFGESECTDDAPF